MERKKSTQLAGMLRKYRESNDLTQEFVARQLNVSRSTYSYYEIGKTEPSLNSLSVLAKLFGINVEDFLCGDRLLSFYDSKLHMPQEPRPTVMGALSAEERQLVALYRIASMKEKRKAVSELQKTKED